MAQQLHVTRNAERSEACPLVSFNCDMYMIHESLHNCLGCESLSSTLSLLSDLQT
jgi:hypothetical protein